MKYGIHSLILLSLAGCGRGDGNFITATGTIEATEVTVSAQAGGIVARRLVDEGSSVQAGDTLVLVDPVDWRLQLRQAEGGYEMAKAQYDMAVRGARSEDIVQAEATYTNAATDLKRMEELVATRSISQKQLDDTRTRFTVAQQTLEKLRSGSRPEEVDAARGRMEQARAQRDALRKKVADCAVLAPITGSVTKRFIEAGELAGTGTPLVRLADLRQMDITIYVSEAQLPGVTLGQIAHVRVDAFSERQFDGKVVFISSIAEFTPKNIQTSDERTKLVFAVKVRVPNPDGFLKAGIPADVVLPIQAR
jgi:HlyD family secretion protein